MKIIYIEAFVFTNLMTLSGSGEEEEEDEMLYIGTKVRIGIAL